MSERKGAVVDVAVKPKVAIGPSTVAGGTVTVAAFVAAVVAFAQGARDEVTVATLAVGALTLVTTLAGRFAQATAATKAAAAPAPIAGELLEAAELRPDPGVERALKVASQARAYAVEALEGLEKHHHAYHDDSAKYAKDVDVDQAHDDEGPAGAEDFLVMSKDYDVDDDDPGPDDDELEDDPRNVELDAHPGEVLGGPAPEEVALVPAHTGLRDPGEEGEGHE